MTGRIVVSIAVFTVVYTLPVAAKGLDRSRPPRAWAQVELIPLDRVRLELLYKSTGVSHAMAKLKYPNGRVLSGTFFHRKTLAVAGLVKSSNYQHPPSGKPNRPAIGQLAGRTTGGIVFTTARRAKRELGTLRVIFETGPFLIANGRNWERFDVSDRSFYRPCSRLAVGRTRQHLIIARGFGQLRVFRQAVRTAVRGQTREPIQVLANIDGGTSAGRQKLPVRAVFLEASASAAAGLPALPTGQAGGRQVSARVE